MTCTMLTDTLTTRQCFAGIQLLLGRKRRLVKGPTAVLQPQLYINLILQEARQVVVGKHTGSVE